VAVTLKQVAVQAGVSRPTANLILLGKGARFSAATREKVVAAAKQLDYRPNLNARGLSQNRSFLIGALVSHDYATQYADYSILLQQQVLSRGYLPVTAISEGAATQRTMLSRLIDARVDALLINREWNDEDGALNRMIEQARAGGTPVVELFVQYNPGTPAICIDWEDAGRLAFVTLLGLGLKRLALWTPLHPQTGGTTDNLEDTHLQWRGWARESRRISQTPRLVIHPLDQGPAVEAPRRDTPLYEAAADMMGSTLAPDGVLACSSNAAAHLSLYLKDNPARKPAGFTIAHWHDPFLERDLSERRITMRVQTERLAGAAVNALFSAIAGEPVQSQSIGPTITIMEP
jgi:DNA-binding LacI/PurR family transcriptional regulator